MPIYAYQHQYFCEGVQLLGGPRVAARELEVTERTMNRIMSNDIALREGFLRDMASALNRRAGACRDLAELLKPEEIGEMLNHYAQKNPGVRWVNDADMA